MRHQLRVARRKSIHDLDLLFILSLTGHDDKPDTGFLIRIVLDEVIEPDGLLISRAVMTPDFIRGLERFFHTGLIEPVLRGRNILLAPAFAELSQYGLILGPRIRQAIHLVFGSL